MKFTKIQWTQISWNPVTGCDRVSRGCDHCYAIAMAKRLKAMGAKRYQKDGNAITSGPGFGVQMHEDLLQRPYQWRGNKTVFVNSMSDLFHSQVSSDFIYRLINVIRDTPQHTYQILTKRPLRAFRVLKGFELPDNLWFGVSVEDMAVSHRIDLLRKISAKKRFVSCEPLLGSLVESDFSAIDWVIVGGESGPHARPMKYEWVVELRDVCTAQNIPFFFKQWGNGNKDRTVDGVIWDENPTVLFT